MTWISSRLKYVASLAYGDALPKDNSGDGDILVYGSNGPFSRFNIANTKSPVIIVGRKGSYGKVSWSLKPCFASDTTFFIDESNTKNNLRWLYYLLQTLELDRGSNETAVPGLSREDAYEKIVLVPSIDKQQLIADYLDRETSRIDALISEKEKLLESLTEKRQALITRAVTRGLDPNVPLKDSGISWLGEIPNHWEIKKLKYVSNIEISNVDKLSIEGQKTVRLCNYLDVYKNETIDSSIEFMISTATDEQIRRLSLRKGDVVLTKDSETPNDIGVPALIAEDFENLVCGYHLAIARPINNVIIGEYLQRVIQSNIIKAYYNIEAVGMTRYGLDKLSIANTPITVPPIKEQEGIIKELKKQFDFYRMISEKAKITIELLKERRSALITAVVTGKIEILDAA